MKPWQEEWTKFSEDAIEAMKSYSDETNEHKEWMTYVYDVDGTYELGGVSYGGQSRIEVSPQEKASQDKLLKNLNVADRKWTIHGHPLKDGKIYTGRQYFSSTDICREFVKSRDNNEYIVQFLVYPHKQMDNRTGQEVFHNRVRILVFPNKDIIMKAMKASNPQVNAESLTVESGQNSQVKQPDGSVKLQNESGVDWFAFQEALGRMGYMGIVDLEGGANGSRYFNSEGRIMIGNLGGVLGILGIIWALSQINKNPIQKSAEHISIVDDLRTYYNS
tara:strand:- start:9685 stop:10512 length:828 start_codon:yes stop_codon:yes gene_type:complete